MLRTIARTVGIAVVGLGLTVAAVGPVLADHVESLVGPGEPTRDFPDGFEPPVDAQASSAVGEWDDPHVGGWGAGPAGSADRPPVVFVHGNTETAAFWTDADCCAGTVVDVRSRFLDHGWTPDELWAISYTGSEGYFTANDVNVEDVYRFVAEVRRFTGAEQVDIVAHSLGVTVVRKAALDHPELSDWTRRIVLIAGANHGTTSCRGAGTLHVSHVCEETEPGSMWLDELNAPGETPPGPEYLVLYDSVADHFYQGPDARSPRLDGACNIDLPGAMHLPIARGEAAVGIYLPFLADGTLPACTP